MLHHFRALGTRRQEDGSNATEYVLILALIAAIIIGAVAIFGNFLSNAFTETCNEISSEASLDPTAGC